MTEIDAPSPPSDYFYPPVSTVCTFPFSSFLKEYHAHLDYFFFIVGLVSRADLNRVTAAEALLKTARSIDERARYEKILSEKGSVLKELKKHSTVQSQNLTNGTVSAFQRYFSGIIQMAALKIPLILSSKQTVMLEDIVKFSKHTDLIAFLVDRKVNELAYGGLQEMEKYFDERLGVQMFRDERDRSLLRLFVEIRNINVHNGGIVNSTFINRVGKIDGYKYAIGKRFHVDFENLVALSENAMKVAMTIDGVVAEKFRLRQKSHRNWIAKPKAH